MHCQSHWWVWSWYPKLQLCCPAAWPWQSSASGGGATEALQSSPKDDAPTLEGRSGPNAPAVSIATGTKRWLDYRSTYFTFFLYSAWSAMSCGQHHVGWGKGVRACDIPNKDSTTLPGCHC